MVASSAVPMSCAAEHGAVDGRDREEGKVPLHLRRLGQTEGLAGGEGYSKIQEGRFGSGKEEGIYSQEQTV